MIEYIKGPVAEITPAYAVIDNLGIGYLINISLYAYERLQQAAEAKLYIYEALREDAHQLFGFIDKRERELFLLLISVSGVGPNTARMILSAMSPNELSAAIASGNDVSLKAVKGIGAKTAQRIIVDLKDKIKTADATLLSKMPSNNEVYEEALAALVMLGFTQAMSQKVLAKLLASNSNLTVEEAIKQALKMM